VILFEADMRKRSDLLPSRECAGACTEGRLFRDPLQ
jgi:hypothetical protein